MRTLYHYREYGISPESLYRDCSITPNPFLPGRWSVNWDDFSRPWTWKKFITKQVAGRNYWILGKDELPADVEDIREQATHRGIPELIIAIREDDGGIEYVGLFKIKRGQYCAQDIERFKK